jgi:hypothetical protein
VSDFYEDDEPVAQRALHGLRGEPLVTITAGGCGTGGSPAVGAGWARHKSGVSMSEADLVTWLRERMVIEEALAERGGRPMADVPEFPMTMTMRLRRGMASILAGGLDDAGRPVLTCACDCATITEVILNCDGAESGTYEVAYTCDGCQTSHWLTITLSGRDHG